VITEEELELIVGNSDKPKRGETFMKNKQVRVKTKINIYINILFDGYEMLVCSYKTGFFGKKKILPGIGAKPYKTLIEASAEARQIKEHFEKDGFETTIYTMERQ
jgi:hypothetical protein